jgi:hypothetical protein
MLTKEVLDEIIRRRSGEGLTLSIEKIEDEKYNKWYIREKAKDYYGSWTCALTANGAKLNIRHNVSRSEVVSELNRLHSEGHSMKSADFEKWLYRGITKYFGGWRNACKELDITQNKQGYMSNKRKNAYADRVIWTDGKIKSELTELLSRGLSRNDMWNENPNLFYAIVRKFNTLEECGDYLGLDIPDKQKNYKHTKDEVDEFIRHSHEAGKNSSYLKNKGTQEEKSLYSSLLRMYGTWTEALKANGIKPKRVNRVFNSKEDVAKTYVEDIRKGVKKSDIRYYKSYFNSLEELERHLGIYKEPAVFEVYEKDTLDTLVFDVYNNEPEKVTVEILDNCDPNIVYSIRHHYNSVTEYFSRMDIDLCAKPYVPFKWDAENIKRQLLRWIREGKPVNYTAVANKNKGLIAASRKFYGNYEGLFDACGLNYDDYRTDTNLASYYGKTLEDVFEDILIDLEIKYESQPEINKCHPDFVSGATWYDAKLSEWTIRHPDCITIEKYEPHCEKLVIVFLRGNKNTDKMITEKTRLVNIYKFVEMLPDAKQTQYLNRLNEIELQVASNELGSQSNDTKTA